MKQQENEKEKEKTRVEQPPRGLRRPHHSMEVRRKAVQLHLQESFPVKLVAKEIGVSTSILGVWIRRYREQGEAGLQDRAHSPRVAAAVKQQVCDLKRAEPTFGVKRIAQWLRRMMFLSVSPETVRQTLHQEKLMEKRRPKPKRRSPTV